MAKRKSKKSSYWSPPAVVGRAVWGRGGFKGAVKRTWRDWTAPQQKARTTIDPDTGKLKAAGVRQRTDGTWEVKPPRRVTAKKRIADKDARNADGLKRHAKHLAAQPTPMTQRVQRTVDGRFNGSAPATPGQRADDAYLNAVRSAEMAEQRANRLLGH